MAHSVIDTRFAQGAHLRKFCTSSLHPPPAGRGSLNLTEQTYSHNEKQQALTSLNILWLVSAEGRFRTYGIRWCSVLNERGQFPQITPQLLSTPIVAAAIVHNNRPIVRISSINGPTSRVTRVTLCLVLSVVWLRLPVMVTTLSQLQRYVMKNACQGWFCDPRRSAVQARSPVSSSCVPV